MVRRGPNRRSHASTVRRPQPDELDEYRCPTPGAAWNAAGNLVTKTTTLLESNERQPRMLNHAWQVLPDGTAKLYSYTSDNNGILTNILVRVGQPDNTISPTNIIEGSQNSASINGLAR